MRLLATRVDGATAVGDDERGIQRPLRGAAGHSNRCDIGAVEYDVYDHIFENGFEVP